MINRTYAIQIVAAEEGGFNVFASALPGCWIQAETCEEAIARARQAIRCYVESLQTLGKTIPNESRPIKRMAVGVQVRIPEAP